MPPRHLSVAGRDLPVYRTQDSPQPEPGSVVLTHGLSGTAWQRFFSDGLWHSTTSRVSDWDTLFTSSPHQGVIVVLDAPEQAE